jgi:hypothetical protein
MMEQGWIFSNLCREKEPSGNSIPVHYHSIPITDGFPDEDKMAAAIHR